MDPRQLDALRERAAAAVRSGPPEEALALLEELERAEPEEPGWPRRRAELLRRLGRREEEVDALERAARLYADAGRVVPALATTRMVLALDPGRRDALHRLESLGAEAEEGTAAAAAPEPRSPDAPLEEVLLTEVVPDAGPPDVELAPDAADEAREIPLDGDTTAGELRLHLSQPDLPAESDPPAEAAAPAAAGAPAGGASADEPLRDTPLFGSLDAASLRRVLARARVVEIAEGETLFRQGDRADALYVVVDGAVVPVAESGDGERTRLAVLEAGAFFGEVALVTDRPRGASVEALVDTRLLVLDRALIWELVREHPPVFRVLLRFLRERLVDRLVRTSPLFRAFGRARRHDVARQFRFLELRDGARAVDQGRTAPALYAVLAGRLDVILMDTDGDKVLASLGPGDLCGERSLLLGEPASASVVANGKCWLLALDARRFRRILDANPRLQEVIEQVCEERQRRNETSLRQGLPDVPGPGWL